MTPHLTPMPRRRAGVLAALAAAVAAAAVLPAAADASTVSLEGGVLVVRGAAGESNWLTVDRNEDQPSKLQIGDISAPDAYPSVCVPDEYSYNVVTCSVPSGGVRLDAGDGDDIIHVGTAPAGTAVAADGGPGNDTLRGTAETPAQLLGGAGDDKIEGGDAGETVDGGPGNDEVLGNKGPDVVLGGDGNDTLGIDYWTEQSDDIVDGGAGYDQIEMNWQSGDDDFQPPIDVSIDGAANDGRPGERDDVTRVERIYLTANATLTGSEGADELTIFNSDGSSKLSGRGGDDKLSAFDLADTIDGGAGADTIEGGYGDDTITGGPGRDMINADVSGTSCHWIQCRMPYGNDTIEARDGEPDTITCGIGTDVVTADPADTVAADCETVNAGAGGQQSGGQQQGQQQGGQDAGPSLADVRVRHRGRRVIVTGRATGVTAVTVKATRGGQPRRPRQGPRPRRPLHRPPARRARRRPRHGRGGHREANALRPVVGGGSCPGCRGPPRRAGGSGEPSVSNRRGSDLPRIYGGQLAPRLAGLDDRACSKRARGRTDRSTTAPRNPAPRSTDPIPAGVQTSRTDRGAMLTEARRGRVGARPVRRSRSTVPLPGAYEPPKAIHRMIVDPGQSSDGGSARGRGGTGRVC